WTPENTRCLKAMRLSDCGASDATVRRTGASVAPRRPPVIVRAPLSAFPPQNRSLPMPATQYDVLGIGNAIVDVIARAEDDFLIKHAMNKGTMALIDEPRAE